MLATDSKMRDEMPVRNHALVPSAGSVTLVTRQRPEAHWSLEAQAGALLAGSHRGCATVAVCEVLRLLTLMVDRAWPHASDRPNKEGYTLTEPGLAVGALVVELRLYRRAVVVEALLVVVDDGQCRARRLGRHGLLLEGAAAPGQEEGEGLPGRQPRGERLWSLVVVIID